MPDTQEVTEELQRQIELQAGAVQTGPDASGLQFTFDTTNVYSINYLAIELGGFGSAEELRAEVTRFVMSREFNILGNPTRLQRVWNVPSAGYPQGPILVWREGHPLSVTSDNDVWSARLTYCVLPPFAQVVGISR